MIHTFLFILIATSAFAQCPVKLTSFDTDGQYPPVILKFTNTSDKQLKAVRFGIQYVDKFGDPVGRPELLTVEVNTKPGKNTKATFDVFPRQKFCRHWVDKVMFADGSVFDGTDRSCGDLK